MIGGIQQESLARLAELVQGRPDDEDAGLDLAEAELANGQVQSGTRRLLEWRSRLTSSTSRRRGAELLLRARCEDEATPLAIRVAQDGPESWAWCWHFAVRMRAIGNLGASRQVLTNLRAAQVEPALRMRADLGLALGLPSAYSSSSELRDVRAQFKDKLATFIRDYDSDTIRSIAPTPDKLCWENFLLAYHGENDLSLQASFGGWLARSLAAVMPEFAERPTSTRRSRPRIAMVSSYFHECTIGWYFGPWVESLARGNWEVVMVLTGLHHDALTDRLARAAHKTILLWGTLSENAADLRNLTADIILYPEIGMDRDVMALAALRLAPASSLRLGPSRNDGASRDRGILNMRGNGTS